MKETEAKTANNPKSPLSVDSRPANYPVGGSSIGSLTQRGVRLSLRIVAISQLVVIAVAAILAGWLRGEIGLKSVGLCALVAVLLIGVTLASHLMTLRSPDLMMAWMGADFVGKLLIILAAVFTARSLGCFDPYTLFCTMIALIICQSIAFPVAISRARLPLIETDVVSDSSELGAESNSD